MTTTDKIVAAAAQAREAQSRIGIGEIGAQLVAAVLVADAIREVAAEIGKIAAAIDALPVD